MREMLVFDILIETNLKLLLLIKLHRMLLIFILLTLFIRISGKVS